MNCTFSSGQAIQELPSLHLTQFTFPINIWFRHSLFTFPDVYYLITKYCMLWTTLQIHFASYIFNYSFSIFLLLLNYSLYSFVASPRVYSHTKRNIFIIIKKNRKLRKVDIPQWGNWKKNWMKNQNVIKV